MPFLIPFVGVVELLSDSELEVVFDMRMRRYEARTENDRAWAVSRRPMQIGYLKILKA
jgi:hypothetical protein